MSAKILKTLEYYQRQIVKHQSVVNAWTVPLITDSEINITYNEISELKDKVLSLQEQFFMATTVETPDEDQIFETNVASVTTLQVKVAEIKRKREVSSKTQSFKLEKIKLPEFKGHFADWPSFQDLFLSAVVNNSSLTDAEKMVYLKTSLAGDATSIVSSFSNANTSFTDAWDFVKKRFNNKREIVFSHIRKFDEFKPIQESAVGLRKLIDIINECTRSLKALKVPVDKWDIILIYIALKKLDFESRKEWLLTQDTALPELSEFIDFLEKRSTALADASTKPKFLSFKPNQKNMHHVDTAKSVPIGSNCVKCNESHRLYQCQTFRSMHPSEKKRLVGENNLCFNCLMKGHSVKKCTNSSSCRKCNKKHHTLLHIDSNPTARHEKTDLAGTSSSSSSSPNQFNQSTNVNTTSADSSLQAQVSSNHSNSQNNETTVVLFETGIGLVPDSYGAKQPCRIFFDPGSETHFITESCVTRLGLKRKKTCVQVGGIGGMDAGKANGIVSFSLHSRVNDKSLQLNALILPKLTKTIPRTQCSSSFSYIEGIQLADPGFNTPGPIDILIGAPLTGKIKLPGLIVGPTGCPDAQNTIFGWTLSGDVPATHQSSCKSSSYSVSTYHSNCLARDPCLDSSLRKFWEWEETDLISSPMSKEDEEVEELFKSTTTRNKEGRYVVRLPFKSTFKELGESRSQAIRRFLSVERTLAKNPDMNASYYHQFHELINNGLVQEVQPHQLKSPNAYYMPHHIVTKAESSTTKHRIVFDASCKTSNGLSLNDVLMTGPKIQTDLVPLLIKFRTHPIAISGDIAKFYNQFCVHEDDLDYQRLVFRPSSAQPIKDYKMARVCFGQTSAPYLAIRCLHQIAEDSVSTYPNLTQILKSEFLVDNLLSGANTVEEALLIQSGIINVLSQAQLKITKWSSNNTEVMNAVLKEDREALSSHHINNQGIKTIGIWWNPSSDSFSIKVYQPTLKTATTKREVLSAIAKTFDPLGWLSPVTVQLKILLQEIWQVKTDWDSPISSSLYNKWFTYCKQLPLLEKFSIQRRIGSDSSSQHHELHGFCDASNAAYSACLYLKSSNSIRLIIAKTKVSPVKGETIPRLELCGAELLAKLISTSLPALSSLVPEIYCWTDSSVVLSWLSSSDKLPVFVHNRVRKIVKVLPTAVWSHVDGKENPADMASRGITPYQFLNSKLWLQGPSWLSSPITCLNTTVIKRSSNSSPFQDMIHQFIMRSSNFIKMKRLLARWIQFIRIVRTKAYSNLNISDLTLAVYHLVKCVQIEAFKEEYQQIASIINNKSKYKSLCPFIDSFGVIRVGGRLRKSFYCYDMKHPILLPKAHHFTYVIIRHYHQTYLHPGPQLLLTLVRDKFWVVRGPQLCAKVVRDCVQCHKANPTPSTQVRGQLPEIRTKPSRPFSTTSVDYAGPFYLCVTPGRKPRIIKAYVCVFVCMAVKAVHLEIASDLSTPSYKAAFARFIARRGLPSQIYCDGGSNFLGHKNELEEFKKFISSKSHQQTIKVFLMDQEVEYHVNPPYGPHFGGIHEAAVKSMKTHLKKIVGDRHLSIEEFITLLCQIEATLNSRPITALSSDPNDLSYLSPGHFLTGGPLLASPQQDLEDVKMYTLTRWQLVQKMAQDFFKRWSHQYVQSLQKSSKWFQQQPNLSVGQLVLMQEAESNLGPQKWKMGRIASVFPDKSGHVRICEVNIPATDSKGNIKIITYRRPITKISPLPE